MPKFDVISIGGAVKDHTLYVSGGKIFSTPQNLTAQKMIAFEYGAKIKTNEAYLTLGGGAANSSTALSKIGFKTAIICRLGNDEVASEITTKLKKSKINTDLIQTDSKHLTGFSFILVPNKKDRERTIFNYTGCGELLSLSAKNFKNIDTKWFFLTSLSGDRWVNNVKEVFKAANNKQTKIYWNPGNRQLQAGKKALSEYLEQTEILTLNKDEAIELVLSGIKLGRKSPKHLNKPIYLLNILHEWGPRVVMITDGKKGAWVYDGRKIYTQKIKNSKVIDRTGVGDCYGSSFLAGYIAEKGNIQKALKYASINSASVVTKVGAQNGLLTGKQLKDKL